MSTIKINIVKEEIPLLSQTINKLNGMVGHDFFQGNSWEEIKFGPCSNGLYHNKLIALLTLWFCEDDNRGFTRIGGCENCGGYAGYLRVNEVEKFANFVESLSSIDLANTKVIVEFCK